MVKQIGFILFLAVAVGGAYGVLNYEVQTQYENGRLACVKIVRRGTAAAPARNEAAAPAAAFRPTFRLATYNLGRFDDAKQANRNVSDVLVRLLPQFDLIALQGIRGKNQGVLVRLTEQINAASGRTFDFATSPAQQRDAVEHYSVFLFDRARLEVDRTTVQFVEDRRFRVKPLVGVFRVRGPNASEAFTFKLINVETDPDNAAAENDLLADVYRTVRDTPSMDGHTEDDILLLGDLQTDDANLGRLGSLLGVAPLVSGVPTTTRGTQRLDNILLDRRATREFTGRVEVVDMLREFELTMPDAMAVSEHLPVWAEFSAYEGGQPGNAVAELPRSQ
jgi:deoxyribonuclease-1-like protein